MRRMPDSPAVSLRQLSAIAGPERGDNPDAVTATGAPTEGPLGEDAISFSLSMSLRSARFVYQRTASTSAMPSPRQWPTT